MAALSIIRRTLEIYATLDDSLLQDQFRQELAEYEEAILGGHHTLGLLIRGTDYISSGQNNGWDTVRAMNGGRFERCERMNAGPAQN